MYFVEMWKYDKKNIDFIKDNKKNYARNIPFLYIII